MGYLRSSLVRLTKKQVRMATNEELVLCILYDLYDELGVYDVSGEETLRRMKKIGKK